MLTDIVSKRIRELRNGIKISQAKLAIKLDTKQPLIARYETGEHLPPLDLLIRYADYFDVSLDFIVGRTDAPQGKLLPKTRRVYFLNPFSKVMPNTSPLTLQKKLRAV